MNNLEWINAEIENTKTYLGIAQCNEVMFGDENNEVYKMLNNKLTYLNQIKTELEAWEAIKKHIEYFPEDYWNGITKEVIALTSPFSREDYPIIKKALEVNKNE